MRNNFEWFGGARRSSIRRLSLPLYFKKNVNMGYEQLSKLYQSTFDKSTDMQPWFIKANQLYTSAHVILEKFKECKKIFFDPIPYEAGPIEYTETQLEAKRFFEISDTFPLLCGLAFENFLKGIIVSRNKSLIENGTSKSPQVNTHDLLKLFETANIELTPKEKIIR